MSKIKETDIDPPTKQDGDKMSSSSSSSGIGFSGLLTVLFVGLKLTGFISWSWWWVTSPIWLPLVSIAAVLIIVFIFTFIRA